MTVIEPRLKVKPGERVVTSGLDSHSNLDAGYWLGDVERIEKTDDMEYELTIRPPVNLKHLEAVCVVLGEKTRSPQQVAAR